MEVFGGRAEGVSRVSTVDASSLFIGIDDYTIVDLSSDRQGRICCMSVQRLKNERLKNRITGMKAINMVEEI